MKILFFTLKFPPSIGGIQNSNFEIVKTMSSLGYEPIVVTINSKVKDKTNKYDGITVERIPDIYVEDLINSHRERKFFKFLKYYFDSFKFLNRVIEEYNPDEIILGGPHARLIYSLFSSLNKFKKKPILIVSVPELNEGGLDKLRLFFVRRLYKKAKKIICVSESTKSYLIKEMAVDSGKLSIIYRTINEKYIESKTDEKATKKIINKHSLSNDKVILTVSRLFEEEKGVDNVIKSLPCIINEIPNIRFLVVGDGKDRGRLEKLAENCNVSNYVVFCGAVPYDEVLNYYDICDLFILPSRRGIKESFGRVFAEAGSRQKPVIANNTGGAIEVVNHKQTGYLVNPSNVDEISKKAIEILMNDDLRVEMGKAARKNIIQKFTNKSLAASLKNILES